MQGIGFFEFALLLLMAGGCGAFVALVAVVVVLVSRKPKG